MGTGKTAVGKALAEKLQKDFFEIDSIIERGAGKPIPEIFREDGEIVFRELEINIIKEISEQPNAVIACGGGVVLNKINIDRLKQKGVVVRLTATPTVILKRCAQDGDTRPLLNAPDMLENIKNLLKFREPLYERAADLTINTSKLEVEEVVDQIIKQLKENESLNFKK
jgi:shikimate kinase